MRQITVHPVLPAALTSLSRVVLLAGFGATLFCTGAQAADGQQFQDAPPPPVLEKLDEGTPPSITIQTPNYAPPPKNSVTQTRNPRGQITDEQVTSSGSTYHVTPPQPDTNAGDDGRKRPVAAQWTLKTFDLGGKKAGKEPAAGAAPASSNRTDPAASDAASR